MASALPRIHAGHGGLLPIEPLLPLIREDARAHDRTAGLNEWSGVAGLTDLANLTGIPLKRLSGYVNGHSQTISLDYADRYLTATGRHLAEVWPWLYTLEQVYADVYATTHEPPELVARRIKERNRGRARTAARIAARVAS